MSAANRCKERVAGAGWVDHKHDHRPNDGAERGELTHVAGSTTFGIGLLLGGDGNVAQSCVSVGHSDVFRQQFPAPLIVVTNGRVEWAAVSFRERP